MYRVRRPYRRSMIAAQEASIHDSCMRAAAPCSATVLRYILPHHAVYTTPARERPPVQPFIYPASQRATITRPSTDTRRARRARRSRPSTSGAACNTHIRHADARTARWRRPGALSLFYFAMPFTRRLPPDRVNAQPSHQLASQSASITRPSTRVGHGGDNTARHSTARSHSHARTRSGASRV